MPDTKQKLVLSVLKVKEICSRPGYVFGINIAVNGADGQSCTFRDIFETGNGVI